jgi:hypothetical protein
MVVVVPVTASEQVEPRFKSALVCHLILTAMSDSTPMAHPPPEPDYNELQCDHQSCRRSFSSMAALSFHKRSCQPSKKRLRGALSIAKELFANRKKRRVEAAASITTVGTPCFLFLFFWLPNILLISIACILYRQPAKLQRAT